VEPTPFPDLNAVLAELVESIRAILGDSLCGVYLQGSFAVGDADEHSDVDFVVATHGEVDDKHVAALQVAHTRLHNLDVPWAKHLEGSYVPVDSLRRIDPGRRSYLYLDNGASELIRDNHCNTQVVRWTLREHGIVFAGPDPQTLIDPISADDLRAEMPRVIADWAQYLHEPAAQRGMSRWLQQHTVLSFCRILHTLAIGEATSKQAAGEWALTALDPEWADLVQQALDDRPDPWKRVHLPADPEAVQRTHEFVAYCGARAGAIEEQSREGDAGRL
jgi:predicted nucleotidyltransferase